MSAKPQPGKDNFTRNLVIGVVLGVVLIMLVPTIISKQTNSSAKIPANVSAERGYGIVFNGELTGVPVLDEQGSRVVHGDIRRDWFRDIRGEDLAEIGEIH